jgi:hypothetical protein
LAKSKLSPQPVPADPAQLAFKRRNETTLTYKLKWTAWEWLHNTAGCRAIAFEVRLEGPFGRIADVVGIGPENRVYLVEVKISRSDKSRDDKTAKDLQRLEDSEPIVEESVRLTAGILEAAAVYAKDSSIEPDDENWRQDAGYRQALGDHGKRVKQRSRLRERIATFSTKFHDPAYLRCAHHHYVMAPSGLIRTDEVPPMWGLLDEHLNTRVEAPYKQVRDATKHVLRAIAKANSRDLMHAYGVKRDKEAPLFPGWDEED